MTDLDVLILCVPLSLLVGFSVRVLASWLAMRNLDKRLRHYIETLRGSQ